MGAKIRLNYNVSGREDNFRVCNLAQNYIASPPHLDNCVFQEVFTQGREKGSKWRPGGGMSGVAGGREG